MLDSYANQSNGKINGDSSNVHSDSSNSNNNRSDGNRKEIPQWPHYLLWMEGILQDLQCLVTILGGLAGVGLLPANHTPATQTSDGTN